MSKMKDELELHRGTAEAIALLLAPYAEVVIHDLRTGRIAALFNGFSKRGVGDASLLDEVEQLSGEQALLPPYLKTNWDGRQLKTTSALLKNREGKLIGLLCINLDISVWHQMNQRILNFIEIATEPPASLFKNDWRELINNYVSTYLRQQGVRLESLSRAEKRDLLLALQREGAFKTKNAASYVAEVLQISRATVYNYLKGAA